MTSTAATLIVEIQGREVGLDALLSRVQTQLQQADQAGQRTAQTFSGTLPAAQQRSTSSTLSLQQAQARLEAQQGNLSGAADRLRAALAQVDTTTVQTIGAQRQLLAVEDALSGKTTSLGSALGAIGGQIGGLPGQLAGVATGIGALTAAAGVAVGTFKSFAEAFVFKAQLDATTTAIQAQLTGVRDSGTTFAQAAQFAERYKLTQAETNKTLQASVGILRQSKSSVDEVFGALLRLQQLSPEQGLEGAALALKELQSGQTTSLVGRFEVSRAAANQMKEAIQGGADAVQVLSQFLNQSGINMGTLAARTQGEQGALNDLKVAQEQLTLAQAEFAQGPGLEILRARIELTRDSTRLLQGDLLAVNEVLGDTGPIGGTVAALGSYNAAVIGAAQGALQWAGILDTNSQAAANATIATQQHTQALTGDADASIGLTDATVQLALAQNEQTAQATLASAESQILAAQQQLLMVAALNAAGGLLSTRDAAAQLAGQFPITAGAAEVLIGKLRELATLQNTLAVARGTQAIGAQGIGGFLADENKKVKQNIAGITANLSRGARAVTNFVNLPKTPRGGGGGGGRKGGGGGGGGAGAVKLSDQQKLNNSLLADQDKYEDQSEQSEIEHEKRLVAIEREHQKRLLQIEKEFQEKSLAQQKANEVDKRQSRADFYDGLTSATKDVGGQVAQELSAAYETAYAEAQRIAQSGNQKLAADYLALKQKQIQAELEFQKAIAKAREDKDKGEIARLEAIHKLRTDAAAEEEKQLLAGGDTNVQARGQALSDEQARRDEALAGEQQRFEDQQDKIATSAERAAQRKIDAAERSGKKVDEENAKLQTQEQILNRIGARGGAAGRAPAAPSGVGTAGGAAAAPTAVSTEAAPAQASLGDVVGALNAVQGVLDGIRGAIENDTKQTTGAIRGLGDRVLK